MMEPYQAPNSNVEVVTKPSSMSELGRVLYLLLGITIGFGTFIIFGLILLTLSFFLFSDVEPGYLGLFCSGILAAVSSGLVCSLFSKKRNSILVHVVALTSVVFLIFWVPITIETTDKHSVHPAEDWGGIFLVGVYLFALAGEYISPVNKYNKNKHRKI